MDLQRNASLRNQAQVFAQVVEGGRLSQRSPTVTRDSSASAQAEIVARGLFISCTTPGREPANRREFLSTSDCAICFHPGRNVLTHCDHMRNATAVVNPHRDLANQPILDLTVWLYRFLFNDFDFASRKNLGKLSL